MDPEMFILTAAGISVNFALAKTVTAIGMGLMAGFSVYGLQKLGFLSDPLKGMTSCGCSKPSPASQRSGVESWRFWQHSERRIIFSEQVRTNGFFLGKWMTLAFFIESLMIAYIPADAVVAVVGSGSVVAIPLSAVIGIPAYMNGYAAIPLIAGLLDLGMAPGAALAFVTAGAVSSIPAAMAVYALVKRQVFLVYLAMGLGGALLAGYLYQLFNLL